MLIVKSFNLKLDDNGRKQFTTENSMIWIPGYFIFKLVKSPGTTLAQVNFDADGLFRLENILFLEMA